MALRRRDGKNMGTLTMDQIVELFAGFNDQRGRAEMEEN